mmetsp:Transcript_85859/g.243531  ORF Transcript_85859/g.243531 Transcript_85859/m.243531 type:complete len:252 (-) Transcript_85859:1546-2301(-)
MPSSRHERRGCRARAALPELLRAAARPVFRRPVAGGGRASPGLDAPALRQQLVAPVRHRLALHRQPGVRPRRLPAGFLRPRPGELRPRLPAGGRGAAPPLREQRRGLPAPSDQRRPAGPEAHRAGRPTAVVVRHPVVQTASAGSLGGPGRREGLHQRGRLQQAPHEAAAPKPEVGARDAAHVACRCLPCVRHQRHRLSDERKASSGPGVAGSHAQERPGPALGGRAGRSPLRVSRRKREPVDGRGRVQGGP